ncbi:MAG: C-type lectin domain-containing protein [Sandaracinus sp.]
MRLSHAAALLALVSSGCVVDRSELFRRPPPADDASGAIDASSELDAAGLDASDLEPIDAWSEDAFAADAYVLPDAYTPPDAFVPVCVPSVESCNGRDDNCDGVVDEGVCIVGLSGGDSLVCESHRRGARTYLVCNAVGSWDLVREICQGFAPSYDLVAFADTAEQDSVRSWIATDSWMGLTDDPARVPAARDGDYRWIDGTGPTFGAWAVGEPSTAMVAGCVELRTDGLWDAGSCDDRSNRAAIVCEAPVL